MSTRILFVRHGESEGNLTGCFYDSPEIALTEKGRLQAVQAGKKLGELLSPNEKYSVYYSPWNRATETCWIAMEESGLEYEVFMDPRLRERLFTGVVGKKIISEGEHYNPNEAISDEEYREIWSYHSLTSKKLGVEPLQSLEERARGFLIDASVKNLDKTIIVFSHGGIGRMVQALCEGWPEWGRFYNMQFLENGEVADWKYM